MRTLQILLFLSCLSIKTTAQFQPNSQWSLGLGYGSQGYDIALDIRLGEYNVSDPFTMGLGKMYLDVGGKPVNFTDKEFVLNSQSYPSYANLTAVGLGIGFDGKINRVSLYPYLGLRYYYVRFSDQALIDAIGQNGIIRYEEDGNGNLTQVGPEVDNGYGNATNIDLGCRFGLHLSNTFEIGALIGFAPVKFSTPESLFVEYRGEAPYHNPYYVQIDPFRYEINLRLNFGQ